MERQIKIIINTITRNKMMNRTIIPRKSEIVSVKNIQKTYETLVRETNECLSELQKEDHKKFYDGHWLEINMIEGDIIKHGRLLEYLKDNHKQFKEELGAKQFNDDNIDFKNRILQSHKNLNYYKKKY